MEQMQVYDVQCSYEQVRFDHGQTGGSTTPGTMYRRNARYMVLTPNGIDSAIAAVEARHPGAEVHQIIKRTHGIDVLVAL
jgi:hypothetical protein